MAQTLTENEPIPDENPWLQKGHVPSIRAPAPTLLSRAGTFAGRRVLDSVIPGAGIALNIRDMLKKRPQTLIENPVLAAAEPPNPYIKPAIVTTVFIIGIALLLGLGTSKEVAQNWSKYRCRPDIMPAANLYGFDAQENIQFCMKNVFMKEAPGVLAPIYETSNSLNSSMASAGSGLMSVRTTLSSLTDGIGQITRSFNSRIQMILQTLKGKFGNLENLMGRVFALFIAIMFAGVSGLAAGSTFAKGTIFAFLDTFGCFPAGTLVKMADGCWKPIEVLVTGEELWSGGGTNVVESFFEFDGSNTEMCAIYGAPVSKNHLIRFEGKWISAGDHPAAKPNKSYKHIFCLNTTNHRFWIHSMQGSLLVADFEESSDVSLQVQEQVETQLNGSVDKKENRIESENYSLGLDGSFEVKTLRGWIPLRDIKINDRLVGGNRVAALVKEFTSTVKTPDGLSMAPAQLIWSDKLKRWERQHARPRTDMEEILYQIMGDTNGIFYIRDPVTKEVMVARDYAEVHDVAIEKIYQDAMQAKS